MDNYTKASLRKKIARLVKRGKLRGKKLVLFGASAFSNEVKGCLAEHGLAVGGVIDNDSRKVGIECMGVKVQKPEAALLPYEESIAVLMYSGDFYREMTQQLVQMGYVKNRSVFILNFKADESLPVMAYEIVRVIRGHRLYQKVRKGAAENDVVFIAPYTGTGDIYLVGLLFNAYLKQNLITGYVFVVVSGACKKVAEMFNIQNIIVIKPTLADDIINCRRFLRAGWPLVVLNDGWLRETSQWLRGYKGLNFEKMFRYFVFGFNDSVRHELPPRKDYGKEVEALFRQYGLIKGKTVVLSPYSNTLFSLPEALWQSIAQHCKALGLAVCTNCAATGEAPIKGTVPVFFPLGQAIAFMDAAGYFIGVRSGLCDIISSSICKKVILYEKGGFFYKSSQYAYFSLAQMGLCGDAVELAYRPDIQENLSDKILGALRETFGSRI
jgi:hypothetical protein